MNKITLAFVALAAITFSCAAPEPEEPVRKDNVKSVELEAPALLMASGGWTSGTKISMLDARGNHVFETTGTGGKAVFTGEATGSATSRDYVYPYSQEYEVRGDSILVNLPSSQKSADASLLVSAARVSMKSGAMEDAFCRVGFNLSASGLTSLKISSPDGKILSGPAALTFNGNGRLVVTPLGGASEITLLSDSFPAGEYSVLMLPCAEVGTLHFRGENGRGEALEADVSCPSLVKGAGLSLGEVKLMEAGVPELPDPLHTEDYDIDVVFIESPTSTSFKWPFQTPLLSEISNSYTTTSAFHGEVVPLVLPESKGGYAFNVYSAHGLAKNGGGSQGLKFGGSKGSYIEFPAVNGLYLTSITMVSGSKGSAGSPSVQGTDGSAVTGGDEIPSFSALGDSMTWTLYGTRKNVPYRLVIGDETGSIFLQQLHLHYSVEPLEYVDPSGMFQEVLPDTIPDFSRVGYHFGDREIPDVPVKITLQAPADGSDAGAMIKEAIASVETPGTILLKAGTYNVEKPVVIDRNGVVLRGEGEGRTTIYCTSTTQVSNVVQIGNGGGRSVSSVSSPIVAKYVPAGQMWVPVRDPGKFAVGDKVFIYRPATNEWLDAIHMREIYTTGTDGITQWTTSGYSIYWERHVTAIDGYKIYLDNPVVMGIGGYGITGYLHKGSWSRVSECGLENLTIDTRYDSSKKSGKDFIDEDHAWSGVTVKNAENCWVRNVTTKHIGYCSVDLGTGAYKVTVDKCTGLLPVSEVTGSRRYAFHFSSSQACLIKNCSCDDDRHQYVCGARVPGPNVFYNCVATNVRSEAGPHQRWTTGVLFDNVKVSGQLNIHDRANYGSGHGWTSATVVLYNCEASSIVCQSPWESAKNWSIGCVGTHRDAARSYSDKLGPRPDGVWISEGTHVSPSSLYLDQLEKRHGDGVWLDK